MSRRRQEKKELTDFTELLWLQVLISTLIKLSQTIKHCNSQIVVLLLFQMFFFPHNTQEVRCDRVGLNPVWCNCPTWQCGKANQRFSSNSMTELFDAPTHHLTLQFSHTFMLTSLPLNCCQPTERGCDAHLCAASSLPTVSQSTFKWGSRYNDSWKCQDGCWRSGFFVKMLFVWNVSTKEERKFNLVKVWRWINIYSSSLQKKAKQTSDQGVSPYCQSRSLACRTACNIPSFWYSMHQGELQICQGTWRRRAAGGNTSS